MRLLIDSLIAMMLVAILAGIILHHRQQERMVLQYQTVHRALGEFRESVVYHGALDRDLVNEWGYPPSISPLWFPEGLPMNLLVPGRHPWLDIAPVGDMNDQPPDPIVNRPDQAAFWYNPNRGLVRARITPQFTEQATLALYNQINGTMLIALPRSDDPARQPVAHELTAPPDLDKVRPAGTGGSLRDIPVTPTTPAATPSAQTAPAPPSLRTSLLGQSR